MARASLAMPLAELDGLVTGASMLASMQKENAWELLLALLAASFY